MKKISLLLFVLALTFVSCSKDESSDKSEINSVFFQLASKSDSGISGTATFTRNDDDTTTILLSISNSSDDVHPAYIQYNDIATTGPVAITLVPIDCDCEESISIVSHLDNGSAISFDELIDFNGYINIHQSATELETIIAQGNIGSNVK
ncbi:CHRD domain-containing protein [Cellulophaga sp. HaHaR_3_176]|uniref:CHRD domain-containing protein n=1 Tax=Cellulophaga sp. HaHaR_3_176 TaxID=1942464 RepID=UPI001C1FA023|nr:CHRD domain-containing protein [Cellulophaga sp. HaHaR_3_176]QWX85152.1 CHRD domain-containing protein [Cellulophaga sp. HaHaR_3_176]